MEGGGAYVGGGYFGERQPPPPIGLHVADGVLFLRGGGEGMLGGGTLLPKIPKGVWGLFFLGGGVVCWGVPPPHSLSTVEGLGGLWGCAPPLSPGATLSPSPAVPRPPLWGRAMSVG